MYKTMKNRQIFVNTKGKMSYIRFAPRAFSKGSPYMQAVENYP